MCQGYGQKQHKTIQTKTSQYTCTLHAAMLHVQNQFNCDLIRPKRITQFICKASLRITSHRFSLTWSNKFFTCT